MAINHLNQFPLENFSMNFNSIQLILLVLGFLEFLKLHIFLDKKRIFNFLKEFQSSKSQSQFINDSEKQSKQENRVDQSVGGEEMEMVLQSLGLFCNSEEKLEINEICDIFEEKDPILDEVKEAFDVFDKNGDGLIDAGELQSVLCALGFNEGLEMENCKRMIGEFDENDDGVIDFEEFVKFMEISLC